MSELSRHFESPEDDDRSRQPDRAPDPPRDPSDDVLDPDLGLIDRVGRVIGGDQPDASPSSPVSFERMSVIDRLAGPAEAREAVEPTEGRLALRGLCHELGGEVYRTVPQDTWKHADPTERAERAREIHAQVRETYELGEGKLRISPELDAKGLFEGGKVIVSEGLLAEETPLELVNTIAHENQHELQAEIISGQREHPLGEFAAAEVEAWRKSDETYNPEDFMGEGYTYDAREVDSRDAGALVVEGYLKAQIADQTEKLRAQDQEIRALKQRAEVQDEQIQALKEMVEKLAADRAPDS